MRGDLRLRKIPLWQPPDRCPAQPAV